MEITTIILLGGLVLVTLALVWLGVRHYKLALRAHSADSELTFARQQLQDMEKTRHEFADIATGRISEQMQKLSTELLKQNKLESSSGQQHYFQEMRKVTTDIHQRLDQTLTRVNELSGVATKSAESFDILHKAIYEPRVAGFAAETALENCLRSFQLREGLNFNLQVSVGTVDGGRIRPDAMVYLPENICLVIDSKSSKFLFDVLDDGNAQNVVDLNDTTTHNNLGKSMRAHINSLNKKDYVDWVYNDYRKHHDDSDVVPKLLLVMWLPSDAALDNVIRADKNILEFARQKNIFMVGPSGLWTIIALAERRIVAARHSGNQELIKKEIELLLKSIGTLDGHLGNLRQGLDKALKYLGSFESSYKKTFTNAANRLVKLGVQAPANWKDRTALPGVDEAEPVSLPQSQQDQQQAKLSLVDESN